MTDGPESREDLASKKENKEKCPEGSMQRTRAVGGGVS